jgi:hypothetical protein
MTPVFLFSLPRSGSTFVQRMLAAHPEVATASEPWILLPLLYSLRRRGVYTEYGHRHAVTGIEDFCTRLPDGADGYGAALAATARHHYAAAAGDGRRYFLDKTPRYHLVADEILRLFPEAKVIVLWRHPLAVAASMIETWGGGRWNLYRFKIDLYVGLANLVAAREAHAGRILAVRYDDLIERPDEAWPRLLAHLGLDDGRDGAAAPPARMPAVDELGGRLGDRTGSARYDRPSAEPLDKWRSVLNNPLRKAWCRRYLRWIGDARLRVMGYRLDELLAEVDAVPATPARLGSDLARIVYGAAFCAFEFRLLWAKLRRRRGGDAPWLIVHY